MSQRNSFLNGVLTTKCPRCREGEMFPKGTLYSTKFADMHGNCPCCGQNFEPEPGYYYGAMYVSFAFNVAIVLIAIYGLSFIMDEVTTVMITAVVVFVVLGLLPIIFRISRSLWIYIFVKYEGPCSEIPKLKSRERREIK